MSERVRFTEELARKVKRRYEIFALADKALTLFEETGDVKYKEEREKLIAELQAMPPSVREAAANGILRYYEQKGIKL